MCAIPVIDKKKAAANAALLVNIVKEINSIAAHICTKTTATYLQKIHDTLQSILMPAREPDLSISMTSAMIVMQAKLLWGHPLTIPT
jgi:hypothetical protein